MSVDAVLVSKKPELDWVQFHWNKMTAAEFEAQWKEKKMSKKADFIHMIQVSAATVALLAHKLCF